MVTYVREVQRKSLRTARPVAVKNQNIDENKYGGLSLYDNPPGVRWGLEKSLNS